MLSTRPGKTTHRQRLTAFLLAFCLLLVIASAAFGQPAPGFLKVVGDRVVDPQGQEVRLRGVNVEFKNFFQVLTAADIARIAELGANSIRLVLDYQDFEPAPFTYNEESFALLEQILDWCRQHRVYVILDMHLAPGKQNTHDFVVHRQDQALFWQEPQNQARFYALWEELARRFHHHWIIVGYDLLNEGTPPSLAKYREVITTAATRIRAVSPHHIMIVEEAIMPGWEKELILIDDPNTIYSIHFFHPPQFAFYSTTSFRPVTTYPGQMRKAGEQLARHRALVNAGDSDTWQRLELRATAPPGAELLRVALEAGNDPGSQAGHGGQIWFDDLRLEIDGQPVDLPAPLVNNSSFSIDYPGFNWKTQGECVQVDRNYGRSGGAALRFNDCRQPAAAFSSAIPVGSGEHLLTGWYRTDPPNQTPAGEAALTLNWYRAATFGYIDRQILVQQIAYALEFRQRHGVPIYVGEFTMHNNPWPTSARRYLHDLLNIMEEAQLHWSFWEYYSIYPGVGLLRDNPPVVGNPVALEVLTRYLSPKTLTPARPSNH